MPGGRIERAHRADDPRRELEHPQQDQPHVDQHGRQRDVDHDTRCSGNSCTGFVAVAQLAATAKSWTDTGVKSRSTYRYQVSASNAWEIAVLNIASATAR